MKNMEENPVSELKVLRNSSRYTLKGFARLLGVSDTTYANWEYGKARTPLAMLEKARAIANGDDVTRPSIPAPELKIQVPYIGQVAASTPVDWSDPFDAIEFEYVPTEMGDAKGRFSARVIGLSMYPLLLPGDLVVFQSTNIPKLGVVVLHRSNDNQVTVKELKHDGERFILSSTNEAFPDVPAEGLVIGHLVGIVREQGSRITTEYDSNGIRP
jgi:SOS-response transcriptional repressor LexA